MTREEAIEVYNGLINTKIKEAFEFFAPELKESEDERIRKGLIEVVSDIAGGWPFEEHRITKKEAIAYLEKQKKSDIPCSKYVEEAVDAFVAEYEKQKELHFGYPGLYFYDGEKLHFQGNPAIEEKQKDADIVQYEEGYNYGYLKGIEVGWQDSLKKQKDEEPIDYDHEMWKNCEANFEGGKKEVINNPEKYGLQKPAEWSEEDETILRLIHEALSCAYSVKNMDAQTCSVMREWLNNRLKSLRPSWKPSEEQMDALHNACYAPELEVYGGMTSWLKGLYEQLKAL